MFVKKLRLAAYVMAIAAMTVPFGVHSAKAEVAKGSMQLGRDLAQLSDVIREPHRVDVSGEHAWISSSLTKLTVKDALDRFEAHCHEGGVAGTWTKATDLDPKAASTSSLDLSVMRDEGRDEGVVLCFVPGEDTPQGVVAKMQAFKKTRNLAAIGKARYAYVRATKTGSEVLAVWTDGSFDTNKIVPHPGYEPGSDDPSIARPVHALRTGSTRIEGTPYGSHTYVSTASAGDVASAYDRDMGALGWAGFDPPIHETQAPGTATRVYMKDGVVVTMRAVPSQAAKGQTVVGIAEMGGGDVAKETAAKITPKISEE